MAEYDAVVVGSGPNGFAAAIALAQHGAKVLILEGKATIGGGMRSAELTLPGFIHDVCSAIHTLAVASPFLKTLPLSDHGLRWIAPPAEVAHPLDGEESTLVWRSVEQTAAELGVDEAAYRQFYGWQARHADAIFSDFLGPFPLIPRHPLLMARFGINALLPAHMLAKLRFRGERARALFAGMASHAIMPLDDVTTAAFGMMLALTAHASGWVFAQGGAQRLADALASYFRSLGGEIVTDHMVVSLKELPPSRAIFLDVTPRQIVAMAGDMLPPRYRQKLIGYRYGSGVYKMDFALSAPIPWRSTRTAQAATVHIGGTLEEFVESEREVGHGQHPERPFVLLTQPTLFDPTRAPEGKHVAWAYCHVPHGSTVDMSDRIEAQIERFAPGFRETILAKNSLTTDQMEGHNPNYIGGDINGGIQDWRQLFTRPMLRLNPYSTPLDNLYICSSSTPPGGGVHGMSGYHAARSAGFLRR